MMSPGLSELPAGALTDHVTAVEKLPLPETAVASCNVVPIVADAGFGVTLTDVMTGAEYPAVTVVSAFRTTVHVAPLDDEHPDQDENLFAPAVFAAVNVTVVPDL